MPKKIVLRVDKQLELLQQKEGRHISIEEIAFVTKLAIGTVRKWHKGHVDRYDSMTLVALCEYFGCEPGDLLHMVDE